MRSTAAWIAATLSLVMPANAAAAGLVIPPVLVGSVATPGDAFDVILTGSYALVPDYSTGLQVIDVSDPTAPAIAGAYDTPGYAVQCVRSGSRVFVADHAGGGLQILNVAVPTLPSLLGSYTVGRAVLGVATSGDVALAGFVDGGFNLVDVSVPAQPTLLQSVATDGAPRHAIFRDGILYVADHGYGLRVYDVSTPAAPVAIAALPLNRPTGLDLTETTIYAADSDGLHVFDGSNPSSPQALGFAPLPGPAIKVQVIDGIAFVADHVAGGLQVVDCTDPGNPLPLTGYPTGYYAHGVAIAAPYAYLADGVSLKVFQVYEFPVPTEQKTIGGVKTLFGRSHE